MRYFIFPLRISCLFFITLLLLLPAPSVAQTQRQNTFISRWLSNVSRTQSEQPHWVTPIVLVTPRLEQEFRADFVRQLVADGHQNWVYDNGKGLELIPARRIELLFNLPPFLQHTAAKTPDGLGDVSFLMKYRILAANEKHGNYILTAYMGGSVPTGTYKNGVNSAQLLPSLGGGKGWGRFDLESTLGGTLPVDSTKVVGRSVVWNSVAQYHVGKFFWPEVESNATYFFGGPNDGKAQNLLTPGLMLGRFPVHNRVGITFGAGMQIATSHDHLYNHALILTGRIPF
ncbi:MAG TPA: hypothetical protein VMU62_04525 [Acidobacteriaceae bacterium]|nr:hypothetical protein [Acidobacteriaceae bacterium]